MPVLEGDSTFVAEDSTVVKDSAKTAPKPAGKAK
jgi:hypothetical protein